MEQNEYKYFNITPSDLFREGHGSGVRINSSNRITLSSSYVSPESGPLTTPVGIGTDRSHILFVIDKSSSCIYYLCPGSDETVKLPCIGGQGSESGRFQFASQTDLVYKRLTDTGTSSTPGNSQTQGAGIMTVDTKAFFGSIAVNRQFILVTDTGNHRVQCFFRTSLQVSFIVNRTLLKRLHDQGHWKHFNRHDQIWEHFSPWDSVIDSFGDVYIIDINSKILFRVSRRGNYAVRVGKDELSDPVSLFLDATDNLYVLDRNKAVVLKKDAGPAGAWSQVVSLDTAISTKRQALGVAVDRENNVYVGECGDEDDLLFHFWNSSGDYAGHFPNRFGCCKRMVAGPDATIYAECAKNGVVKLNDNKSFAKEGIFFSRIFDGGVGTKPLLWHRVVADVELPSGTSFGIDYIADDQVKNVNNPWMAGNSKWIKLLTVFGDDSPSVDALMAHVQGRFLMFRIRLGGNGVSTPALRRIRITYPHDSYLRYLPAIFQEDPIGRDITDRFLSLFESFNMDIEEQIGLLSRLVDPASTRSDFLPWLASWLGIVMDENWSEAKFRELLSRSYTLFQVRGTLQGLSEMVKLYTGSTVTIIEHFRYLRPMVLGADVRVGMSSVVGRKFKEPLVIEESSTIGEFTLIEEEESPESPFVADAYDFTLIVNKSDLTDTQYACLVRLIDNSKPAHTRYHLQLNQEEVSRVGTALLGMDTRITHAYHPMELGTRSHIGFTTIPGKRYPPRGLYSIHSRIGIETYLH